jgi:hypothetical protein
VKLMYAGAALDAIGLLIYLVSIGTIRTAIRKADPSWSTSRVHTAVVAFVGLEVILALIGIGLWLWMAWANKGGRSWARIVALVLFGLSTLFLLLSVAQLHAALGLLLELLGWLVGMGATISLWRKDSSAYYQASRS